MSASRQAAVVIVVAAVVMFANLGGARLWDRDEPRNAGCAREMLERGDWVTPVFNGELRSHKPVLVYWLMMSAYSLFGVSEFAARFWSAALSIGTAVCTLAIGRRILGTDCGLWAGLVVSTCVLFAVVGRAATPDAALIFCSTLALTIYVFGVPASSWRGAASAGTPPERFFPANWFVAAASYAVMGLGVLAKGPVGLVMPTAVIGMFLLIMRLPNRGVADDRREASSPAKLQQLLSRAVQGGTRVVGRIATTFAPGHFLQTCWVMRPFTAIVAALGLALPWYLWVGLRTDGEFLRGFFLDHNLGRAAAAMEGHAGSPLYYPLTMLIGLFPWSVFLIPVALETRAGLRPAVGRRPGHLFALCWIGVYVGVFSLARTKLPSYIAPCYPALALLVGSSLQRWCAGKAASLLLWRRLSCASLVLVGILLLIALPLVAQRHLPGEQWLGALGLIPLLGGMVCWVLLTRDRWNGFAATFAMTAMLFVTGLLGVVAERVSAHQQNHVLLAKVAEQEDPVELAAFGLLEPSWVFYGGRSINELHASGDAVWLGQWIQTDGRWRPKPAQGLADLTGSSRQPNALIITTDRHLAQLEAKLSAPVEILADVPLFLKRDRLLLVRPGGAERQFAERRERQEVRR